MVRGIVDNDPAVGGHFFRNFITANTNASVALLRHRRSITGSKLRGLQGLMKKKCCLLCGVQIKQGSRCKEDSRDDCKQDSKLAGLAFDQVITNKVEAKSTS